VHLPIIANILLLLLLSGPAFAFFFQAVSILQIDESFLVCKATLLLPLKAERFLTLDNLVIASLSCGLPTLLSGTCIG